MDLKRPGNLIYLVGATHNELGGSHYELVHGLTGGQVPHVDAKRARQTFAALHQAINRSLVRACHDLSEGGLAVAAAEMAFAGGLGLTIELAKVNVAGDESSDAVWLFSESNTRFLCEVSPDKAAEFQKTLAGIACARIGEVTAVSQLRIAGLAGSNIIDVPTTEAKQAWQAPLKW
jgi:phosphoribosylformylglycinamidine synthase